MRFTAPPTPPVDTMDAEEGIRLLSRYAYRSFRQLSLLLNNGVTPEDQFNAEESEVEFSGSAVTVSHGLKRVPDRVEVVRADQSGQVYVTARSELEVTLSATSNGTYRVRVS